MSEFKTYKFDELYEMGSGISSKPDQAGHGTPFVSFSTIFNNYFLPEELPDLMSVSVKEEETYSVKKGDIFLTRTSETLDELAMSSVALKDYPRATFSGFAKRLRPLQDNVTYDRFMGFYLRSPYFRKVIDNNAVMTLRASFNEDIFSYLKIILPDYPTQVKIGDLLYAMEEKKRLNNKINCELENLVKMIYHYWFTQFEFPNEEGKPYRSSGGAMEWHTQLKRDVPKGWTVRKLSDCTKHINTGLNPRQNFVLGKGQNRYITIKNIENGRINFDKCDLIDDEALHKVHQRSKIDVGDILYTSIEPVGRLYLIRERPADWDINESVFSIRTNRDVVSTQYLYAALDSDTFRAMTVPLCTGSVQKGIRIGVLEELPILIPKNETLKLFSARVTPLYDKMGIIEKENIELDKLRNWLLPMLVNGQVTVE